MGTGCVVVLFVSIASTQYLLLTIGGI